VALSLPNCQPPPPPWPLPPPPPVNCTYINDGLTSVVHRAPAFFELQPAYTYCEGSLASECDLVLLDGAARWELKTNLSPPDSLDASGRAVSSPEFHRTLTHELGHMFGLGDQTPDQCDIGTEAPKMCQRNFPGFPSAGARWDMPAPLDIDALHTTLGRYTVVDRSVQVMRGDVGFGGGITWAEDSSNFSGLSSVTRPRLSCQQTGGVPDCVMAVVDSQYRVVLRSIFLNSTNTWEQNSFVMLPGNARHEPDLAFGWNGGGHAVAVKLDPMTRNAQWARWDLASGGEVVQGTFIDSTTGVAFSSREAPRIAWFRGMPFQNTGNLYVAVMTDPARKIFISVSSDTTGRTFRPAMPATFLGATARVAYGQLDVVCPQHQQTSQGGVNINCLLVISDIQSNQAEQYQGVSVGDHSADGRLTVCSFTIVAGDAGPLTCSITDVNAAHAFSLGDFGRASAPPMTPVGPGWLLLTSRRSPLSQQNTQSVFTFGVGSGAFRDILADTHREFDTPFGTGAPAFSPWGGVSCDWVEYAQRFLCVQLKGGVRW
jgi:hypothetical protein